ncbi:hypothetical protein GCM10009861_26560 [Neomicrococcus aestuarii]
MDNGLIFPYRRKTVPYQYRFLLTTPKILLFSFGRMVVLAAWDPGM